MQVVFVINVGSMFVVTGETRFPALLNPVLYPSSGQKEALASLRDLLTPLFDLMKERRLLNLKKV
jgi:hypothetical protein